MARVKIKDIAKQLNLSVSTVSKALRDYPDIGAGTKRRVHALAKKLNYQPDILARNLQSKSSKTIAVIVPDIVYFFFNDAISGISEVANKEGYTLMLTQSKEDHEREALITRSLLSNRIAGLLVSMSKTTRDIDHFRIVRNKQIPLVLFDRVHENLDVSKIVSDDYNGAFEAVAYLIESGCRRIAHITGPRNLHISRHRLNGYRDALLKYNLPVDEQLIYEGSFQVQDGIDGMREFFKQSIPPDAVFTANDEEAFGVYEVIEENGLKIPADISVIGFSNDRISSYMDPSLTTVAQPAFEIGKAAAQVLIEEIAANLESKHLTPRTEYFQSRLILRNSTRPAAILTES